MPQSQKVGKKYLNLTPSSVTKGGEKPGPFYRGQWDHAGVLRTNEHRLVILRAGPPHVGAPGSPHSGTWTACAQPLWDNNTGNSANVQVGRTGAGVCKASGYRRGWALSWAQPDCTQGLDLPPALTWTLLLHYKPWTIFHSVFYL